MSMTRRFPAVAAALAMLVALAGCLTTPPSSVVKLARLSPLDADPSAVRLAVRLPEALVVRDGDIRLRIGFDGGSETTRLVEEYAAVITDGSGGMPGIAIDESDGTHVFVAALTEEDAAALAETQKRIRAWRTAGIEGEGQLAVMATACADGPVPEGPIPLTTWMRTSPDEPFFIVARNIDLRQQIDRGSRPDDLIGRCSADADETG